MCEEMKRKVLVRIVDKLTWEEQHNGWIYLYMYIQVKFGLLVVYCNMVECFVYSLVIWKHHFSFCHLKKMDLYENDIYVFLWYANLDFATAWFFDCWLSILFPTTNKNNTQSRKENLK